MDHKPNMQKKYFLNPVGLVFFGVFTLGIIFWNIAAPSIIGFISLLVVVSGLIIFIYRILKQLRQYRKEGIYYNKYNKYF